jgi:hypothetical protein
MAVVPPSQTRMCNGTLALLGDSRTIASINDGTPLAKLFFGIWDETRDEVLADHPWNFAITRASLPADAGVPEGSQYAQQFLKPGDCLRWLPWREDHPDYFAGEEEGNFILSDADAPIVIRYIRRNDDVSEWTPGFRAAMSAKLAVKLAKPITGQSVMIKTAQDAYDDELRKAKRQDGAATGDRQRQADHRSNWLAARNRRWNG